MGTYDVRRGNTTMVVFSKLPNEITSKQNMAQIYVGTVIEFPVRLLGGIVNNVKLIPRLAED